MAAYLTNARPVSVATSPPTPTGTATEPPAAGRRTYVQLCSACHGLDGEGIPHVAPPMRTNASLRLVSPRNLLVAVTAGLPERPLPNGERFQAMPGFDRLLADSQIADLANYLRAAWGVPAARVTPEDVRAARPTRP
jgi:mono/diheme cytochrome c family protein